MEETKLIRFYRKIGIDDSDIQQGMSMFWLIAVSLIGLAMAVSVVVKFIIWLF